MTLDNELDQPPNPFIVQVLAMLKQAPQGIKVYELVGGLDQLLLEALVDTTDFNLATFRKNFWLMNALFQLQSHLVKDGIYLDIGQVNIVLTVALEGAQGDADLVGNANAKLRDYYFDWGNYHETSSAHVDQLLNSFWKRYVSVDKITQALATLQLLDNKQHSSDALDWAVVQRQYRLLASQNHPDKGGDATTFIEIREAYELLQIHFNQKLD